MSEQHLKKITIPACVVRDENLVPRDKVIYGIIYELHQLHGECRQENEEIAEKGGCSVNSVKRALPELEKRGYIQRVYRDTKNRARDRVVPRVVSKWVDPNKSKGKEKESNQRKHQTKVPLTNINKPRENKESKEQRKNSIKKKKKERRKEFIRQKRNKIADYWKKNIRNNAHLSKKAKKKIDLRLKEYSATELKKAINNFSEDEWWMDNNAHRGMAWFFHSEDRIEQFLNLDEKQKSKKTIKL